MFPRLTMKDLEEMILSHKDMFADIELLIAEFRETIISPDDIANDMQKLGGYYASINTGLAKIEAEINILEDAEFGKQLDSITNSGNKVNTTVLSKQVDKACTKEVEDYLRANKIYKAYLDSCDRLISICQSTLKSYEKDRYNTTR